MEEKLSNPNSRRSNVILNIALIFYITIIHSASINLC